MDGFLGSRLTAGLVFLSEYTGLSCLAAAAFLLFDAAAFLRFAADACLLFRAASCLFLAASASFLSSAVRGVRTVLLWLSGAAFLPGPELSED